MQHNQEYYVLPSCRSLKRILPPRDAEGSNLPPRFWTVNQPYPRWIKQGTSGGPGTYEGGNYPAWNYQPLTRRDARPRTRPNHPRERVTASVRSHDYHGKRSRPKKPEKPVLLFRGFAEILRISRCAFARWIFPSSPSRRFEKRASVSIRNVWSSIETKLINSLCLFINSFFDPYQSIWLIQNFINFLYFFFHEV